MATSIRLNRQFRAKIIRLALDHSFDARFAELAKAEDKLGRELHKEIIPANELRAVAKLPKRWTQLDKCLRFNVGGMTMVFKLAGDGVPVPPNNGYCSPIGVITAQADVDRARKHFDAVKGLKEERERASAQLWALLNSVANVKALAELWPEGARFYSELEPAAPNLPAPVFRDVNKLLGLTTRAAQ